MLESPTCNRRTMLCLMSSALAFISLPLMFPVKSVAKALSPVALDHFEHQVYQDFVAGRITVVDGWVLSDSEMALLAIEKRPL